MGRVDGLALVMPVDDQRICSHGDMWSAEGPCLVAYEGVVEVRWFRKRGNWMMVLVGVSIFDATRIVQFVVHAFYGPRL